MSNYTYSGAEVTIVINGVEIKGRPDGDFLNISFNQDSFTEVEGVDGDVTWSALSSTLATMTVTLQGSSPSNDVLSGFHITDRATKLGTFAVFVKDNSGRDLFVSDAARIKKFPDMSKGKEVSSREWVISCANSQMFIGGH